MKTTEQLKWEIENATMRLRMSGHHRKYWLGVIAAARKELAKRG